jgi:hypothetical protein
MMWGMNMTRQLLLLGVILLAGACGGGQGGDDPADAGFDKEIAYNPKDAGWAVLDGAAGDGTPSEEILEPGDAVPLEDAGADDVAGLEDVPAPEDTPSPEDTPPAPDLPPPPPDGDGDGIPDAFDPFPGDPDKPGTGSAMSVYMHTASSLWKLDVKTYSVSKIGDFDWPGGIFASDEMTDIAIDRYGVLYGVSFDTAYVCHPGTAECWKLGALPDSFNGLTLVPEGVIEPDRDVLVGISGDGGWYRIDVSGTSISTTKLGQFGGGYSSSGDAYSIVGVGTFAAANKSGASDDYLVELDPVTGAVVAEIGVLSGYASVWGLAGWTDKAFAFDAGGDIVIVDTTSGQVTQVIEETSQAWWGAGVRTLIY